MAPPTVLPDAPGYRDDLLRLGVEAGLSAAGVALAEAWPDALARMEDRKRDGHDAGMPFTYRDPSRATDPRHAVPGAASLVVGAYAYRRRPPPAEAGANRASRRPVGRVAAYAWLDHQDVLRQALKAVARKLKDDGFRARVLVDDNGLVDREAAHRAGLGWFGKNANILLPGRGSWFVLGAVVTSAPLPPTGPPVDDGCGTCRRCLDGCPTGAIVAPGWSTPAGACPGCSRSTATSRAPSARRSATASTAATTARRCARPTGVATTQRATGPHR